MMGEAWATAIFMPGIEKSMLYWARPVVFSTESRRLSDFPMILKSFGSFSATFSGTGSVAALAARSP